MQDPDTITEADLEQNTFAHASAAIYGDAHLQGNVQLRNDLQLAQGGRRTAMPSRGGGLSMSALQEQQLALRAFEREHRKNNNNHGSGGQVLSAEAMRNSRFARNMGSSRRQMPLPTHLLPPHAPSGVAAAQQHFEFNASPPEAAVQVENITPATRPPPQESPAKTRARKIQKTLLNEARQEATPNSRKMKKDLYFALHQKNASLHQPIMESIRNSVLDQTGTPDCKEELVFLYGDHPDLGKT